MHPQFLTSGSGDRALMEVHFKHHWQKSSAASGNSRRIRLATPHSGIKNKIFPASTSTFLQRLEEASSCRRRRASNCEQLSRQIDLCEIDDFVAASTENRLEGERAEAFHLLRSDRRRHRQFLPGYGNFNWSGAVMLQTLELLAQKACEGLDRLDTGCLCPPVSLSFPDTAQS